MKNTLDYNLIPHGFIQCINSLCPKIIALTNRSVTPKVSKIIIALLPRRKEYTFRSMLISALGRKNYYLTRNGNRLLLLSEQRIVIHAAREAEIQLEDYFDSYEYHYNW